MGRLGYIVGLGLLASLLLAGETRTVTPLEVPSQAPISFYIAPSAEDSSSAVPAPAAVEAIAVGRAIEGARILVPRLGIDLALAWGELERDVPRDGFEGATPERLALVFPGSALPEAGGNTYIYAHARTGMFLSLWGARQGDLVVLQWPDAELLYAVQLVLPRVDPADSSWLDPRGPERLTLQTSTGPRASDPRFVVVVAPLGGSQ